VKCVAEGSTEVKRSLAQAGPFSDDTNFRIGLYTFTGITTGKKKADRRNLTFDSTLSN
jgi:hypothetical protein